MFTLSYIISMYLIFINISLTFIGKNIKYLVIFMIALMWALYGGCTDNADSDNYRLLYAQVTKTGEGFFASEIGFVNLIKLAVYFKLSYNQFLMAISFVALSLLYATISRYTKKAMYVWSLYFIYPFLMDIVQVRHFLAMSIVVYAIKYIEKEQSLKYIFTILLAFSIQFSAIIFLPFVFVYKMKIRKVWIVAILVVVLGSFIVKTSIIQDIVGLIVSIDKLNSYFENKAKYGFLIQWIIQLLYMMPIYLIYKKFQKEKLKIIEIVYKLNIYVLMMFPIYMINMTSSRIFRMTLILNYIVYAIGFFKLKKQKKIILFLYILFLVSGMFAYDIYFMSYDTVLLPIFQNNMFLN